MAIKSVNAENIAQFVADKQARGAAIASPAEVAAIEAKVTAEKGVIVGATTETVSDAPDPGVQEPTAKAEGKEEPKEGEPGWYRKALKKLQETNRDLDEFAKSEYETRVQLQERLKALEAAKPPEPVKKDERPDRTQYKAEEAEKYEDDLLAWNRKQAIAEFQEQERERALHERLRSMRDVAKKEFADFDEVIDRASSRPGNVPAYVTAAVHESDVGAHLAYHLAKHPDEASRIFAMSPFKGIAALAKIEEQYTSKTASPPVSSSAAAPAKEPASQAPISKAPPPMPSITAGAGDVSVDLAKPMDYRDYKRLRHDQMRKARR